MISQLTLIQLQLVTAKVIWSLHRESAFTWLGWHEPTEVTGIATGIEALHVSI